MTMGDQYPPETGFGSERVHAATGPGLVAPARHCMWVGSDLKEAQLIELPRLFPPPGQGKQRLEQLHISVPALDQGGSSNCLTMESGHQASSWICLWFCQGHSGSVPLAVGMNPGFDRSCGTLTSFNHSLVRIWETFDQILHFGAPSLCVVGP